MFPLANLTVVKAQCRLRSQNALLVGNARWCAQSSFGNGAMVEQAEGEIIEQTVVREVAGIVRSPDILDTVVEALQLAGFDRAGIDLMGDVRTINERFGDTFIPVEDLADVPGAPRRAYVMRDDVSLVRAGVFGLLFYGGPRSRR
jgi:hypothetical protein